MHNLSGVPTSIKTKRVQLQVFNAHSTPAPNILRQTVNSLLMVLHAGVWVLVTPEPDSEFSQP